MTLKFEEAEQGGEWLDQQFPLLAAYENVVQSLETCFNVINITSVDLSILRASLFLKISVVILTYSQG